MNSIPEINPSLLRKDVAPIERARMSRDEFLRILVSEISNQDPLDPLDHKEFLGQLATLQELEATSTLTEGIQSLSRFQEMGAASALIGRSVTGNDDTGVPVSGVVDRVTVEGPNVRLLVDGRAVAMANVREIQAAPSASTSAGSR